MSCSCDDLEKNRQNIEMLKVQIQKEFSNFTIDLNLKVKPAFTALFGPSGVGKTTTLNIIAGLIQPERGEISLDDRKLFSHVSKINLSPQKRNIGYIFQESRLFPHLSVKKNLEFGLHGIAENQRKFAFNDIVEITGVTKFLKRTSGDLSGGETQRVALARALLASPEYLLMDEPLAALDFPARLSFLNYLKEIHKRFALPILYVSHDLSNVLNFADQVIILKYGRNVSYGPPYSLLDKMTAPPLISREDIPNIFEINILSNNLAKGLTVAAVDNVNFILPYLDCPIGEKMLLNIPASEIIISIAEPENISASNILPGIITEIHHLNERIFLDVDVGVQFTVEIVPATIDRLDLTKSKEVFLIIKASSFRRLG